MDKEPILRIKNITKEFSGVKVLNDISLDIFQGDVIGLIGENGAGKSTLLKIISGIYTPTTGALELNGKKIEMKDSIVAKKNGIGIVPQEFNLVNNLTVYENIFLGNEFVHKGVFLNKAQMKIEAKKYLDELEANVPVTDLLENLSVAQKQMVEVAKSLVHKAQILILDEPTTTLTPHEVDVLFALIDRLKKAGVTIIFISHKLHEVKRLCNRVVVLRDGNLVCTEDCASLSESDMVNRMVGRDFSQVFPPKQEKTLDTPALEIKDFTIPGLLDNISFDIKKGEVLGFAGLVGAGRTELAEAIMGIRKVTKGSISVSGTKVAIRNPKDAVAQKIAYISEDRKEKGIVMNFDIPKNITLISLKKYIKGFIDKKAEAKTAEYYIEKFNVAASSLKMALRYFSGGNQQKVYLARWMDTKPDILILDEPTRGIDVKAKSEIYSFIQDLAKQGIACMVISSEMEEIIGLCTRVCVMRMGKIAGEVTGTSINEKDILYLATGVQGGAE